MSSQSPQQCEQPSTAQNTPGCVLNTFGLGTLGSKMTPNKVHHRVATTAGLNNNRSTSLLLNEHACYRVGRVFGICLDDAESGCP